MTVSIAPEVTADAQAERVFSKSIVISAIRCVLAYVIFPFAAPLVGFADVGPWVGVAISIVAIYFNAYSIKRFWAANHRWKYVMTTLNVGVIVLVTILFVIDVQTIFG
ncbi:MAG: hypothetical protein HKN03_12875 [Acidimicrobiales bacterium]|nr:hypothetical protein [Acidimicrobiales bacterium]